MSRVYKCISWFVNYLDFPKYAVKGWVLWNNCSKTTHYAQKYLFYSLSIILFFENSSSKTSGLLFIFVLISTGHTHFSTDKLHISCESDSPTWVFFSCETAVNTARKAWFKVCKESLHTVFNPERNSPLSKTYQALFSLYFSYMGCFHQLMVCSCGHRKTNKYTYTHTHTHTHTHTLFGKQFQESGHTPGLKIHVCSILFYSITAL